MAKKKDTEIDDKQELLQNIIGLGKFSARKSYYPELQDKIKELKDEKDKFERIFSDALNGIFQAEIDGKIIVANPAMVKLCGYKSIGELKSITNIGNQLFANADEKEKLLIQLREKKSVIGYETNFIREDKSTIDVSLNASLHQSTECDYIECFVQNISEEKKARKALRESEVRFRKLFNNLGDAVFVTKFGDVGQDKIIEVNNEATNQTGYSYDELIGMDIVKDLVIPESRKFSAEEVEEKVLAGESITTTEKKRRKDGSEYWIEVLITPLDYMGEKACLSINRDITERKRYESELRKTQMHYTEFMNNTSELVTYWKTPEGIKIDLPKQKQIEMLYDSVCIDANKASWERYGFDSKKEFLGCKASSILKDKALDEAIVQFIDNDYKLYNHETHQLLKKKDYNYILNNWYGVVENGELTHIWLISKNITELKKTELALRESEEKFRDLAENSATIIYRILLKPEFKFDYITPIVTDITGYTPEEHYADPDLGYKLVHPDDRHLWEEVEKKTKGEPVILRWIRKDGVAIWIEIRNILILDENDEATVVEGTVRDVTEQIEYEKGLKDNQDKLEVMVKERTKALADLNKRLEIEIEKQKEAEKRVKESLKQEQQVNELKTRFISTVSHEIRTPLTAIKSSSDLLKRYSQRWDNDKKMEHLSRINNSVDYLTTLVENVLTMSRTETGKIINSPEMINLRELIDDVITKTKLIDDDKHLIKIEYTGQMSTIYLDPRLIHLMFNNILSNAIKYSPSNSVISIEVELNDILKIKITDEGIGIPQEGIELLFEPFYRAENAEKYKGSGLGLSIVKKTVEMIGGVISVESQIHKGTTFLIKIPIKNK